MGAKLGHFVSKETREKMRIYMKGRYVGRKISEEQKKQISIARKGKSLTEEHRKALSKNHWSKKEGYVNPNKGKHLEYMKGEKNPRWKGGITPLNYKIRHCLKYLKWRSDCFSRDNWTCQTCRKRGLALEAHHIKSFSKLMKENNIKAVEEAENCEELWDSNNGVTLCEECHLLTDNYKKRT